jgi:hypothetical protein
MTPLVRIKVVCLRDGQIIGSCEIPCVVNTRVPTPPPDKQYLIDEAKRYLTTVRIDFPPYAGIDFKIEYPCWGGAG